MKRMMIFAVGALIAFSAAAQPGDGKGTKHALTIEQRAQRQTDQMAKELVLTEKQVKKLYNFNLKDIKYRQENFGGGRPERPEGKPQGEFKGQKPQGRPEMGEGRPEKGEGHPGMGQGHHGGRPPQMGSMSEDDLEAMEKYNQKQEKKLRKILGEDNYAKWRSAHPMKGQELPEPELK